MYREYAAMLSLRASASKKPSATRDTDAAKIARVFGTLTEAVTREVSEHWPFSDPIVRVASELFAPASPLEAILNDYRERLSRAQADAKRGEVGRAVERYAADRARSERDQLARDFVRDFRDGATMQRDSDRRTG